MKKKIWITGVVLIAILIIIGGYTILKPVSLSCIEIEAKNYRDLFKEDGKVTAKEAVLLYAPIDEKVVKINVTEGQVVKKGDILLTFDQTNLLFQLENLEGQKNALLGSKLAEGEKVDVYKISAQKDAIALAQSNLNEAKAQYERDKILFDQEAISNLAFEASEKRVKDAVENLDLQNAMLKSLNKTNELTQGSTKQYEGLMQQIEAQMDALQYQIDQCSIIAPLDGVVSEFSLKSGDRSLMGTQIMRLFIPDQYEVEALVLSEDADDLKIGAETEIIKKTKGEDQTLRGTIKAIAPTAVETVSTLGLIEQRVKVTLSLMTDQTALVRPGDKVEVHFISFSAPNCIVIPKDAIFPLNNSDYVWIVVDGKAVLREITKAYEADQDVVIGKGLESDEKVIYPLKNLKISEGLSVKATLITTN